MAFEWDLGLAHSSIWNYGVPFHIYHPLISPDGTTFYKRAESPPRELVRHHHCILERGSQVIYPDGRPGFKSSGHMPTVPAGRRFNRRMILMTTEQNESNHNEQLKSIPLIDHLNAHLRAEHDWREPGGLHLEREYLALRFITRGSCAFSHRGRSFTLIGQTLWVFMLGKASSMVM